jgi:hypothetical protein
MQEGSSGVLDFPEEHPAIVARAVISIYGGKFSEDPQMDYSDIAHPRPISGSATAASSTALTSQPPVSVIDVCLRTCSVADQYGLETLAKEVGQKLVPELNASLKKGTAGDIEKCRLMLEGVLALSTKSSENLRLCFINVCVSNHKIVQANPGLLQSVMEHEPIAFRTGLHLLEGLSKAFKGSNTCPTCGIYNPCSSAIDDKGAMTIICKSSRCSKMYFSTDQGLWM